MVMLDTVAGADSPVHVYQEIDSIDQSVGKGRFRSWSTDLGLDTMGILHPKIFGVFSCHFDKILVLLVPVPPKTSN